MQTIWNKKYMIISAIIEAIGRITKGVKKNLEAVPGRHSIDSLQRTAVLYVLVTSNITRKVLQFET